MRLSILILLSSMAVAIFPHVQVERATPGEEVLGSIPAVTARSLYWLGQSQYNVTGWDRSHGLPALSREWQHVKLSDISLAARSRYSLVTDMLTVQKK